MKLIVGLGNPEPKYDKTRHNVGFMLLNKMLVDISCKKKFQGHLYEFNIKGQKVLFLKPDTYMNNSGLSVSQCVKFYDIEVDDILVIYDDIDLMFGKIRIKKASSAGGHNGIKSIINSLGSKDFTKLKIGVLNEFKKSTRDFVLSRFSSNELIELDNLFSQYQDVVYDFIDDNDHLKLMNKYN